MASTSQAYLNSSKKEQDRLAKGSKESSKITEKANGKVSTAWQQARNLVVGKHGPQATATALLSKYSQTSKARFEPEKTTAAKLLNKQSHGTGPGFQSPPPEVPRSKPKEISKPSYQLPEPIKPKLMS